MSVEKELDKFGRFIIQQSRSRLSKAKKRDTGELYDSLSYDVKVSKNSFQFSVYAEDYATFVDKGVKGVKSSSKAPNSPYKFGTGSGKGSSGGLRKSIDKWVVRKRIQFRTSKGRFQSYKQTSSAITSIIWNTGLETTDFLTKPFNQGFKKLPDEILNAYALNAEKLLKSALNNI